MHSGAQLEYEAPPFESHSPTDSDSDSGSEEEGPREQLIHDVWLDIAECPKDLNFLAFEMPLPSGTSTVGRRQSAEVTVRNRRVSKDHAAIVVGTDSVTLRQLSDNSRTRVRDADGCTRVSLTGAGATAALESDWTFELGSDRIKCCITFERSRRGRKDVEARAGRAVFA